MGRVTFALILFVVGSLWGCGAARTVIHTADTPMMGEKSAPHVLVVYSDFQCPFCKQAAMMLQQFVARHPKDAAIYFKHFPLRQHPMAYRAALAAQAANLQGQFWPMHDLIFANAGGLTPHRFVQFAKTIGLDVEKFNVDIESDAVVARIAADKQEGEDLGLQGTPFFVLDGKPFDGRMSALLTKLEVGRPNPDQ